MNARDTTKVYIWSLDTGCGTTLYRKYHSHNTPGERHNNTWVEPLAGNCTTSSTRQREQVWQKCKIQKNWKANSSKRDCSILKVYNICLITFKPFRKVKTLIWFQSMYWTEAMTFWGSIYTVYDLQRIDCLLFQFKRKEHINGQFDNKRIKRFNKQQNRIQNGTTPFKTPKASTTKQTFGRS